METFLIRAAQLILSLSILVIVHEFGHFIFARIFKIKVEKFYLFFDPWFSLLKFKPKNSDTEYGIGWLPLGGYVKIAGMIDESMDKEQLNQPEQPWEFRSKPAYQRLLVMTAGVIFNFLLALLIYSSVLFAWGDTYIPLHNVTMGMDFSDTAKEIGFKDGDILWSADGVEFQRFNEATLHQIVESKEVVVKRENAFATVAIPSDMMQRLLKEKKGFASMRYPMIVKKVHSQEAINAGLTEGDQIASINGEATETVIDVFTALSNNKSKEIALGYLRAGSLITKQVQVNENGEIGFYTVDPAGIYTPTKTTYSFFESIPAGINLGVKKLTGYVGSMKYVFTKEGAGSLGGFGAIASLFPSVWNWRFFWETTAFLSIMLAFMNILPIPALDGGHVLFLLFEVITRKKPNEKFMEYAQIGGMLLLFGLLIYANGNDIFRFLTK